MAVDGPGANGKGVALVDHEKTMDQAVSGKGLSANR